MDYKAILKVLLHLGIGIYTQVAIEDEVEGDKNAIELNAGRKIGGIISESRRDLSLVEGAKKRKKKTEYEQRIDYIRSELDRLSR